MVRSKQFVDLQSANRSTLLQYILVPDMTMGKVNTVGGDSHEQFIWKNPDFVEDETRNAISNKTFNRATPR